MRISTMSRAPNARPHLSSISSNLARRVGWLADGPTTRVAAVSMLVSRWTPGDRQGLHQLLDATPAAGAARRSNLSVLRDRLGHPFESRAENRAENRATVAENMMASGCRIRDVDLAWQMAAFRWKPTRRQATTPPLIQLNRLPQRGVFLLR